MAASINAENMKYVLIGEIRFFETLLRMSSVDIKIRPHFHTNDTRYRLLVDLLNGHYSEWEEIEKRKLMAAEAESEEELI